MKGLDGLAWVVDRKRPFAGGFDRVITPSNYPTPQHPTPPHNTHRTSRRGCPRRRKSGYCGSSSPARRSCGASTRRSARGARITARCVCVLDFGYVGGCICVSGFVGACVRIMKSPSHARTHEHSYTQSPPQLEALILMEHCAGGSLLDMVRARATLGQ